MAQIATPVRAIAPASRAAIASGAPSSPVRDVPGVGVGDTCTASGVAVGVGAALSVGAALGIAVWAGDAVAEGVLGTTVGAAGDGRAVAGGAVAGRGVGGGGVGGGGVAWPTTFTVPRMVGCTAQK